MSNDVSRLHSTETPSWGGLSIEGGKGVARTVGRLCIHV